MIKIADLGLILLKFQHFATYVAKVFVNFAFDIINTH